MSQSNAPFSIRMVQSRLAAMMPSRRPCVTALVCWLLLGFLCSLGLLPARAMEVPALDGRVTDLTGTLDYQQSLALERQLAAFESGKGSQIAVLMVSSTTPESIEQFASRVADEWRIGRRGVDDGVILVVAKDDHRMRIEVGYGLEGALTDATCKRIISEVIAPAFKQQRYYEGISEGTNRIMAVIQGQALPPPARGGVGLLSQRQWIALFIVFAVFFALGYIVRWLTSAFPAALAVGLFEGLVAAHMSGAPWLGVTTGLLVTFIAYQIYGGGFGFGRYYDDDDWRWGRRRYGYDNSGWGWGWGSGGSSSGSSDSGGFSGGGGSFGGGGASGDW